MPYKKSRVTIFLIFSLAVTLLSYGLFNQSTANTEYAKQFEAFNNDLAEAEKAYSEVSTKIDSTKAKINALLKRRETQIDYRARDARNEAYENVELSLVFDCKKIHSGAYCLKIVNKSDFYIRDITGEITTYSAGKEWKTFRSTSGHWYFAIVTDEFGVQKGYVAAPFHKGRGTANEVFVTNFVPYYELNVGPEERARAAAGTLRLRNLIEGSPQKRVALDSKVTLKGEIRFVEEPIASDESGSRTYSSLPVDFRDLVASELESNEQDKRLLIELRQDLELLEGELETCHKAIEEIKISRPDRGGIFSAFYGPQ